MDEGHWHWHEDTPEWAKDLAEQVRDEFKEIKGLLREIDADVDKPKAGKPVNGILTIGGNVSDITVLDSGGPLAATLSLTDAAGQPADLSQLVSPPVWASDNPGTADVSVAADGMSATVTLGTAGAAIISVVATDADGTVLNFAGTVTVQAGEAVAGSVDFAPPAA